MQPTTADASSVATAAAAIALEEMAERKRKKKRKKKRKNAPPVRESPSYVEEALKGKSNIQASVKTINARF